MFHTKLVNILQLKMLHMQLMVAIMDLKIENSYMKLGGKYLINQCKCLFGLIISILVVFFGSSCNEKENDVIKYVTVTDGLVQNLKMLLKLMRILLKTI